MDRTPEFYEQEYHARDSIPNYSQYFVDWRTNSEAARSELTCHLDLAYGPASQDKLDLFPAAGNHSRTLLIFLHGGYWHSMDKSDYSCMAPAFVQAGISVAVPNYSLCPDVSMMTIVEQCRRSTAWLHQHAPELGVNADRIIITGHSAGGHLTGMLFATRWSDYGMPPEAIVGGISLSGLFDLEPMLHLQMNADLRLDEETARLLSPSLLPCQLSVPLVAAVGTLESGEFRRQNRLITEVWPQVCFPPLELLGIHHFNILDVFTDLDSVIWQQGRIFLEPA